MAENLILRKESGWLVICTMPDICKTPPCIPVPYPVVAFLNDSVKTQDNVKANKHAFVLHDQSYVSTTWGDQLGILKGIKSQTVGAHCYPIDKSDTFKVNGKWTVRVDDAFWMNGKGGQGNTRGKVVKMPPLNEMIDMALDGLQLGLDIVGLIPGLGEIADGINCVVSLARGDYEGAALSAMAMIPFAGTAATTVKVGKKVVDAADTVTDATRAATKRSRSPNQNGGNSKGNDTGCKNGKCDGVGKPVNPYYGCKVLKGDDDTDFVLNAAMPFIWQRSYASDSLIGTKAYPIAWYGQGWDNPYGIQIKVLPSFGKTLVILPLGVEVEFPYLEPGDEHYIVEKNITLIREMVSAERTATDYKFRIAVGTVESANTFYEFEHQVQKRGTKPEYKVLCTGVTDLYNNQIRLEYLHKDEARQNYPSHIVDSLQRVLALKFNEINKNIRLTEIKHLQGLGEVDPLKLVKDQQALSLEERLFNAERESHREFIDFDEYLNAKTLARYQYSADADLIQVHVDDSPVEAKEPSEYKTRLVRKFEWNNHVMTAHHIIGGMSSYYEYDEYSVKGKVVKHWISSGEEFLFQYELNKTIVTFAPQTALEKTQIYEYNKDFYLTRFTNGLGYSESYQYNHQQQLIQKTDAEGGVTAYQYTGAELTKIRSLIDYDEITQLPTWREISLSWTDGRLTQITDPLGNTETTAYDFAGQPLVITDALGHQTKIQYTPTGMAYQVTDAKGGHKRMLWDMYGNLKKYQDCSGKTTHYRYDAYGRVTQIENALGHITQFKYQGHQNQPIEIIYPDSSTEQFKYDHLERLIEYRDALGRTTIYQYSVDSLPVKRIDAANGEVTYHYDQLRRFVGLTNENAQTWTMEYDANDQVIAETTFDLVRTEYQYSPAGHLIKHRQFTDQKQLRYSTIFKRDKLGQLLEQYIVDHQDLTEKKRTRFEYDMAGQLTQARNADSHVKLSYDELGQLSKEQLIAHWFNEATQEHIKRTHTLTHLYDELGNRIETTLPDGRKLKTMYYGSGHAWNYALEDGDGIHEISSLKRDDLHQEIERTQGQLHSQYKLDRMGRLKEQQVAWQDQPSHKRLERLYDYDKAGQLKEILDYRYSAKQAQLQDQWGSNSHLNTTQKWQRKQNYQYDVLSRLTSSELSSQGQNENYLQIRERFAFDPASNILPIASQQEEQKSKIKDNRVKRLEQEHQTVEYDYDDLGRVTQKRIYIKDQHAFGHIQKHQSTHHLLSQFTTREIHLTWDEQNQLTASSSIKPDGRGGQEIIQTQYCYDPFGRRIAKQSQVYQKHIITRKIEAKYHTPETKTYINESNPVSNQLGYSAQMSLGGQLAKARPIIQTPAKTITEQRTQLVQNIAVWNVWDGNRILQDYNGQHVFTTVYEAESFVPLARLVWLDDKLTQAANDETPTQESQDKLIQLKHIALQNIGELEGLDINQTEINQASNDEPLKHAKHEIFWYQNDHLGTPRELTEKTGDIAWEAVYQAWGNTVTVEWQEKEIAETQELNPIHLNELQKAYLLQPHRFQGQIYDVETGLHYNRFRYYDPDAGRFISHDPIGLLGGDNNFQYAPNPIHWIDPWGLAKKPKPPSNQALSDGANATPADITQSMIGGGSRNGQQEVRQNLIDNAQGQYQCWRCGQTSTNPSNMHLGHVNVPTSRGGNLDPVNVALEGAACNLSAGNRGYVSSGMSCVERGGCGAPYGRFD